MQDENFNHSQLDKIIKDIQDHKWVSQEDVRKMCSGEPVLTKTQLEKVRRMRELQSKSLLQENIA